MPHGSGKFDADLIVFADIRVSSVKSNGRQTLADLAHE